MLCECLTTNRSLAFIIEKSISDKLEQFIADTKLSKTATVEKALEEYIEKYNKTGKSKNKKRQPLPKK